MESFSHIASPWAVDSKGTKVATHYVVKGALLVQVVEPTKSSAYPILADPTWTWYTAAYGVKFNRSETRTLAVSGGVTGMCVYLKKAASSVAAKICAFAGAYLFAQASIAEGAKPKECIFVSVVPAPLVWRLKC